MRCLILLAALLSVCRISCTEKNASRDSLVYMLSITKDPSEHIRIYRHLADISYGEKDEIKYLEKLYGEASRAGQTETALEALSDLSIAFSMTREPDSARRYLELVRDMETGSTEGLWSAYTSMFLFNNELLEGKAGKTVQEKLDRYKTAAGKNEGNIYRQIENAYSIGIVHLSREKAEEAVPYLATADELASKLPFKDGCRYRITIKRRLARAYLMTGRNEKSVGLLENSIKLQERYFDTYYRRARPFYRMDEFYISCYTSMLLNLDSMPPERVKFYLDRLAHLCRDSDNPKYRYSYYLSLNNYHLSRKEWEKALSYGDSLIKYARDIAPYNLPGLYFVNSAIYEKLGLPAPALEYFKQAHTMQDSVNSAISQQKLDELKVEYDIDRLSYEKSQLEVRNKRMMIAGLSVMLSVVGGLCVYLYVLLHRERVVKMKLARYRELAEEGEKMKTAFISSMCHEIRTPLNAIVGFSDLLLDPSFGPGDRETFSAKVSLSAGELTAIIDGMIEVASLDISDERLPVEPYDISVICAEEMEYLAKHARNGVECRVEFPDGPLEAMTNVHYLSLLLEHLLANAAKFTEEGSITLRCTGEGDSVVISVTDTGCGIPEHHRQAVFGRFTKLDAHKQGSGLGLYLCRLIAKRLGGKIFIDTEYANGTRMVVVLPAA